MRKIVVFMLLLLMATGVAFAEGEPGTEPGTEPESGQDVILQEPEESGFSVMELEIDLKDVTMTFDQGPYEETGLPINPEVTLTYGEVTLLKDTDYTLEYQNSDAPGTATIIATAKAGSGYTGTKSATFTITAKPQLALIDLSKATMKLSKTEYYKTGSAIKPVPVLTYNGKTLTNGTDYTLTYKNNVNVGTATVTATYVKGSNYTGTKSITFKIVLKKPAAAAITKIKSSKPYVVVTWKKVTCTGYELQVSLNSDFSKATTYKLQAVTKKVPRLKNGKKYYFRVRAYNIDNNKTAKGAWSKDSAKVKTTGPVGDKYSKNGAFVKDKTIKIDGNYYYFNDSGVKSGCSEKMWDKVKNTSSKTKYLIAVDCTKNRACIYKGKKGNWELKDYWKCTTGKKSTPTIKGKFKVCGKVSHFGEQKGYSVWYATRIKYEYYFHSILYKPWSKSSVLSGTLGKNKSHGCIRLKLKNAKWIYKNCKSGTKIVIY